MEGGQSVVRGRHDDPGGKSEGSWGEEYEERVEKGGGRGMEKKEETDKITFDIVYNCELELFTSEP